MLVFTKSDTREKRNISVLQVSLSEKTCAAFQISPADTLAVAQSLYEKKLTTYPRTDCRFLSTVVANDFRRKGFAIPERYVDDSKITDHYAIVPVYGADASKISGLEEKAYQAIVQRFMDILKPPFVYNAVSITYLHTNGERFFETIRKIKQFGFKNRSREKDNNKEIPAKGSTIFVSEFSLRPLETKPPVPYTTGTLVMAMEKAGKLIEDEVLREQIKTCGIGTSATRASIIEKLAAKTFITVDKKQTIAPTELGKAIIPIVAKYDEALVSPVKTADMEANLHSIADGSLSLSDYRMAINKYVMDTTNYILVNNKENLSSVGSSTSKNDVSELGVCPNCGGSIVSGQYGPYCKNKCGINLGKAYGKALTESQIKNLLMGKKVLVKGFISKKTGRTYDAYLTMVGVEEYIWNGKKGKQIKYNMEYHS